jgi:hypothetical protein
MFPLAQMWMKGGVALFIQWGNTKQELYSNNRALMTFHSFIILRSVIFDEKAEVPQIP